MSSSESITASDLTSSSPSPPASGSAITGSSEKGLTETVPKKAIKNRMNMYSMSGPSFSFLSLIGPYVLIGFFALHSIFNTNIKGFVYLFGVMILLFLSNILKFASNVNDDDNLNPICTGFFGFNSILQNNIPFGVLIYTFTFVYLLIPMIQTMTINYSLLMLILLILGVDVIIQLQHGCTNIQSLLITMIFSIFIGLVWASFIMNVSSDLAYHVDYLSNKQVCSMPSEQKFKCKVYKNGELITTMSK